MDEPQPNTYSLDTLQKTALSIMVVLTLVTFVGSNLQAILWQSSDWLVSAVLPATVIDMTNQERSNLDQVPLVRNAALDAAAQLKAEDMAKNEYFAHFSPAGVSPWYWFKEMGYTYAYAGENLAIYFTDSAELVDAWMKSPTHRENIVNSRYTETGVGTAKGTYEGYETVYVVQFFGSPGVVPTKPAREVQEPDVAIAQSAPDTQPVAVAEITTAPAEVIPEIAEEPQMNPPETVLEPPVEETLPVVVSETPVPVSVAQTATQPEPAEITNTPELAFEAGSNPSEEIVIIESPIISTSSGLAIANITTEAPAHAGGTAVASIATKPSALLQFVYLGLGFIVFLLLTASVVLEARQLRLVQVAYSVLLLFGMGGLWFLNSVLTSGAVIL